MTQGSAFWGEKGLNFKFTGDISLYLTGDISYASRVIAYFIFKFRYHGNKGRSGVNLNDSIK